MVSGLIVSLLMKVDPAFFFWIMQFYRAQIWLLDTYILGPIFRVTITNGRREEEARAKTDYSRSAQIVSVIGRGSYCYAGKHSLDNFFYRHVKYVNPRHVLKADNITLQGITPTHAFFCVTPPGDSKTGVYETEKAPFTYILQYLMSEQMVIMPLESLNKLAAEVGDPAVESLTFVNSTARCGGTLLCQMLARVPGVQVMSEPWSLLHLHGHYNQGRIKLPDYRNLIRSIVRIQCKKIHGKSTSHIVIKLPFPCAPQAQILKLLFPQAKYLFMTRHPKDSTLSSLRVFKSFPYIYTSLLAKAKEFTYEHLPIPYDNDKLQEWRTSFFPTLLYLTRNQRNTARNYAGAILCYLENKELYDKALVYDDLMENPEKEMSSLFILLSLSREHVRLALKAVVKADPQSPAVKSKDVIDWAEIDRVYDKEFQLPFNSQSSVNKFKKEIYNGKKL